MPNLDEKIAEWRRQMTAAGVKNPVLLDELESHLREDVEQQVLSGAQAQQAFEAAVRRMGRADALKAEFEKAGGAIGVSVWKRDLISNRCLILFSFGLMGVLYPAVVLYAFCKPGIDLSAGERILGLVAVALTVLPVYCWRYFVRFLPVIHNKRVRTAVGVACVFAACMWLVTFMLFILPHFDLTAEQLPVALLWAMATMAVLGSMGLGMDQAARKRIVTAGPRML
jgi:hypothetical protein